MIVNVSPEESPEPKLLTKVVVTTVNVGEIQILVTVPNIPTGQTPPAGVSTTTQPQTKTVILVCNSCFFMSDNYTYRLLIDQV